MLKIYFKNQNLLFLGSEEDLFKVKCKKIYVLFLITLSIISRFLQFLFYLDLSESKFEYNYNPLSKNILIKHSLLSIKKVFSNINLLANFVISFS